MLILVHWLLNWVKLVIYKGANAASGGDEEDGEEQEEADATK